MNEFYNALARGRATAFPTAIKYAADVVALA